MTPWWVGPIVWAVFLLVVFLLYGRDERRHKNRNR